MNKKVNNILYISLSITVALLVLYVFLFISLKNDVSLANQILSEALASSKNAEKLLQTEKVVKESGDLVVDIDKHIISKDDKGLAIFLNILESSGPKLGVDVHIATLAEVEQVNTPSLFRTLKISVNLQGSWKAIFAYLKVVEDIPYKINIDKVSYSKTLSNTKDKGIVDNGLWSGTIDFTVLSFK